MKQTEFFLKNLSYTRLSVRSSSQWTNSYWN